MEKKWSIGIVILGWFYLIGGTTLIGCIIFSLFSSDIQWIIQKLPFAILFTLFGVFLLCRRNWARLGIVAMLSIGILLSLFFSIYCRVFSVWLFLRITIAIVIIYYLTRPKVKEQFK